MEVLSRCIESVNKEIKRFFILKIMADEVHIF
jgi:hypothetical protein